MIGREAELERLEKLYKSDQFEFLVMYGRRRVGKNPRFFRNLPAGIK